VETQTNKRFMRMIEERTLGFGPKRKGPNLLISRHLRKEDSFFQRIYQQAEAVLGIPRQPEPTGDKAERRQKEYDEKFAKVQEVLSAHSVTWKDICNAMLTGFDIATVSGPLCEEPMLGAAFLVENIDLVVKREDEERKDDGYGPFSGQVIATVKDLCKRAFLNAEPRIVEGMYLVSMHAMPDSYGKIYGVINKCRGRVVKEEVQEGTNNFLIDALVPVIEGFVFNEEIRSKSCGIAYPQLVFSGFEIIQDDPFFIPMTEEELEDHGQGDILPPNPAKVIIEKVRLRKGLQVDQKIVAGSAEQQRTLSKKK